MRGKKYIYKFADKRREQVCLVHNTCARRRDLTLPKGSRNVFHCCGPIRLLVALCIDSATEHVHAGHLFSCPQILVLCLHFTPTLGFFSSLCIAPLILLCSSPISPLIPSSHLFPYLLSSLPFVSSFSSHLFSCSPPSPLIPSSHLFPSSPPSPPHLGSVLPQTQRKRQTCDPERRTEQCFGCKDIVWLVWVGVQSWVSEQVC